MKRLIRINKTDSSEIRKYEREHYKDYSKILFKVLYKKGLVKYYDEPYGCITLKEECFQGKETYINIYGDKSSATYMFNIHCGDFYYPTDYFENVIAVLNTLLVRGVSGCTF